MLATRLHMHSPVAIGLAQIHASARNPRLYLREDVVEGICTQVLRDRGIPPWYAVVVRPREAGGYELLAGHHRLEAVRRANVQGAGITVVPAWVLAEITGAEANRLQVLSNLQTGLSGLEFGLFLLQEFPEVKARRHYGRGRQGGLRQCARELVMPESKLRRCRDAAVVFDSLRGHPLEVTAQFPGAAFAEKTFQLAEIARVEYPQIWWALVSTCLTQDWTVEQARRMVRAVRAHFVPLLKRRSDRPGKLDLWINVALPVRSYMMGRRSLRAALAEVSQVLGIAPAPAAEPPAGTGGRPGCRFVCGDTLEVLSRWEPGSIDLVVTSPPWYNTRHVRPAALFPDYAAFGTFLGTLSAALFRALGEGRFCCLHIADTVDPVTKQRLPLVADATQRFLGAGFIYVDQIAITRPFPFHSRSPARNRQRSPVAALHSLHAAVLVLRKPGLPPFTQFESDVDCVWLTTVWADVPATRPRPPDQTPSFHAQIPHRLIRMYSRAGDVVLDPFAGTGTTLVEAVALGRSGIGIDCREDVIPLIQSAVPGVHVTVQ